MFFFLSNTLIFLFCFEFHLRLSHFKILINLNSLRPAPHFRYFVWFLFFRLKTVLKKIIRSIRCVCWMLFFSKIYCEFIWTNRLRPHSIYEHRLRWVAASVFNNQINLVDSVCCRCVCDFMFFFLALHLSISFYSRASLYVILYSFS